MLITSGAARAVNPTSVVWRLAHALRRLPPTLFSVSASAALCFQAALLDRAVSAHIPVEMKEISPASAIGSSVMSWGGSDRLVRNLIINWVVWVEQCKPANITHCLLSSPAK